jgi:hypothetical protein
MSHLRDLARVGPRAVLQLHASIVARGRLTLGVYLPFWIGGSRRHSGVQSSSSSSSSIPIPSPTTTTNPNCNIAFSIRMLRHHCRGTNSSPPRPMGVVRVGCRGR